MPGETLNGSISRATHTNTHQLLKRPLAATQQNDDSQKSSAKRDLLQKQGLPPQLAAQLVRQIQDPDRNLCQRPASHGLLLREQQLRPGCIHSIGTLHDHHLDQGTRTETCNNKLNFQQTLQTECRIFDWFGHRISSHNFVRLASYYMKKWDQMAEQRGLDIRIFSQSQKSFVLYNHILYFCESQLRLKKALLQIDLKRIFKHTISKGSRSKEEIIDHIFSEPFLSQTEQHRYAFEIGEEEERQEQRNASFSQWEEQYEKKGQSVRSRFKEFRTCDNYGHFLSLIF